MPSLERFRIEFDRLGATYMTGETVTGNIIVETCNIKKIRGLYLSVTGKAQVLWTETQTKTNSQNKSNTITETYSNSEKYFNFEFNLLGAKKSNIQIDIEPGYHSYPFSFQLPHNIPSSFEHTYGHVRYTVKCVMDRPWRFNHECKAAFTVLSILDLNAHLQKCLAIDDDVIKNFCSFCCIDKGSINVRVRLPSAGYVPGQTINTAIDFVNSSDSVRVTKIDTKLEQRLRFHASSKTRTESCLIVMSNNKGPFATKGQVVPELLIPPIPPSFLEYCNIIDIEYILRAIVHVSGVHWAVNKEYPVIIGTVPLYLPPSAPPMDRINNSTNGELNKVPLPMQVPMPMPMPMPVPVQPSAPYLPPYQPSSSHDPDAIQPAGFVHPDQPGTSTDWQIPPPSYEECMSGTEHIKDHDDSNYVFGASVPFAPRYPVFNYPSPSIYNK